jgi:hypothetical protein
MRRLLLAAVLLLATVTTTSAQIPTPIPGQCTDWNGRGGCGINDQFVEVYFSTATSMAGWRMEIGDCEYIYAADNLVDPFQVLFADLMEDCTSGFPSSGIAVLYDNNGVIRDFRMYLTVTEGHSWQAEISTDPHGDWTSAAPNPGR